MSKVEDLVPDLKPGSEPPIDPLFITLFPNIDDGSVTVALKSDMFRLRAWSLMSLRTQIWLVQSLSMR